MKVRHKTHGTVVQVPDELANWTPDRNQPNPEKVKAGRPQTTPWFQWAQWEQVDDSTPVTAGAKSEPEPEATKAAASKSAK